MQRRPLLMFNDELLIANDRLLPGSDIPDVYGGHKILTKISDFNCLPKLQVFSYASIPNRRDVDRNFVALMLCRYAAMPLFVPNDLFRVEKCCRPCR
jgi:hypothetical protein